MNKGDQPFFRGWKLLIPIYILLLSISWSFEHVTKKDLVEESSNLENFTYQKGQEVDTYRLPYFIYKSQDDEVLQPILIQAGFDQNLEDLKILASHLSRKRDVFLIPYNGQINDSEHLPSYDLGIQADIIMNLIDSRNLNQVHLIGSGLGFAATLNVVNDDPSLFESLISYNGRAIQELELLGGYHLNHAIYGANYLVGWIGRNMLPDFGLMNQAIMSEERALSFYALDLTESRQQATAINKPVLIVHDDKSGNKARISEELSRIIPQSKLIQNDKETAFYADLILEFLNQVETKGELLQRKNAEEDRIEQSKEEYKPGQDLLLRGENLIIVMILLVLATLVSEDLTCIGAGLMVARGIIGHIPAIVACLIGIFLGDILIYLLGRWLGRSAIRKRPFKWFIDEQDLDRSYQWFELKGPVIIIASRFVPGSRFPTYFTAGAIGASFFMFMVYFGLSALIWTPILVELAVLVGNEMISYFEIYQEYALWVLLGVLFLFMVIFKLIIPSFTYRGRRLIYSRYKRIINWEYWPVWIIYTPVFFYILYLAVKYRSLTVFTAANPGIEDGGFKGESKSQILSSLKKEDVAQFKLLKEELSIEDKCHAIHKFLDDHELNFPVVLKPDNGERGRGVHIVKDELMMEKAIRLIKGDVIVQEFIKGKEFGVFYFKMPGQSEGEIFSITEKSLHKLIGDGKHNLEHLILSDERAVCLAQHHIDQHSDHIFDRPEDGEVIELVELGTHARGALFYDGMRYKTDALRRKMDEIAKPFKGFMFGRFDIKTESIDSFMRGEQYKVLELNGVTSEATHIYNPGYSILNAWRVLFRQWELAFRIGKMNIERGEEATQLRQLISRVLS